MRIRKTLIQASLSIGLALLCSSAFASSNPWSVFAQAGTLGAGIDLGYQISPAFNVRANINGLNLSHTFHDNEMDYDASIHLRTAGLLADYSPFGNGFQVTAGAYYNGNSVEGTGRFNTDIDVQVGRHVVRVNPNDYGTMRFKAHYQRFAPYLGLGYHSTKERGWSVAVDVGVLYQGNGQVSYDIPAVVQSVQSSQLNNDIERDKQTIRSRVNDFRWYPVASLGLMYRF